MLTDTKTPTTITVADAQELLQRCGVRRSIPLLAGLLGVVGLVQLARNHAAD